MLPNSAYSSSLCDLEKTSNTSIIAKSEQITLVASPSAPLEVGSAIQFQIKLCPVNNNFKLSRIDAWMPAHGHGMNYQPEIKSQPDSTYMVAPFLFHMPGKWQFRARITNGDERFELTSDFDIKP